jgi:hypothetical protein
MSLVGGGRFRANPRYELVLADRLTDAERHLLGDLDDDLYGVLRPCRDSGLETRSCSPDTALLFLTLAEPGLLPAFARKSLGDDGERVLARLVIDDVLEVSTDEGFRSGPAAADLVLPGRSDAGQGRIAELSAAALLYGQALASLSVETLASRLYFYGRRPVSPELRHQMPDEGAVDEYVGVASGGPVSRILNAGWNQKPDAPGHPSPWRYWAPMRGRRGMPGPGRAGPAYKLYVSPSVDAMPEAIAAVTGSLAASPGVNGFKIARDLGGICRPDKIVAYFDRLDDLKEGASRIAEQINGIPAQGVPFTAAVTLDGLLSWGADPPPDPAAPTSWRMWVAEHLAEYLVMARGLEGSGGGRHRGPEADGIGHGESADQGGIQPWQFALERLRLAGVNTDTWVPASGMWCEALAMS